jgi:hypothetical protein
MPLIPALLHVQFKAHCHWTIFADNFPAELRILLLHESRRCHCIEVGKFLRGVLRGDVACEVLDRGALPIA